MSNLVVFGWMIKNAKCLEKVLFTDQPAVTAKVEGYARLCFACQLVVSLSLAIMYTYAAAEEPTVSSFLFGLLTSWILYPAYLLCVLFYSETRRLRKGIKDFVALAEQR